MVKNVKFDEVDLLNGFWKNRYDLNAEKSVYAVKNRFEETDRFNAVRFIKTENPPHVFFDSDVAKWIEAVAYLFAKEGEKYSDLVDFCDRLISKIKQNQMPDGYFNSYFQQIEPTERFKRRNEHELYCAGHFIEAAIAYDKYVKKPDLLRVMEKYVALIKKNFYGKRRSRVRYLRARGNRTRFV